MQSARKPTDWTTAPLEQLIEHILGVYHRPLDDRLPRIEELCIAVARQDVRFGRLCDAASALCADLKQHMVKEEQILFPFVLSGNGPSAAMPMRVMEAEHRQVEALLHTIRLEASEFEVPTEAGPDVIELWASLRWLDEELRDHILLEDEILFPRALAGE